VETDRRLTRAVMFVLGVCMVGVLYFRFVLEETWVQSLYYVAITVSTIGYETPPGLEDPADMLFLIGLIILGVSSGAYTVTLVVAHILEGELADRLERRKMQKTIANLEGHTIVCGIGRVGRLIARDLAEYGHTSVLIDKNEEILAEHRDDGMLVLQGDATEEAILEAAGIERAASLISAVPGDAESVFLTLTARFMNRKIRIVARGSDETSERKLRRAGANAVILPNLIGGRRMAQAVAQPNVMDFLELTLGRGRHSLRLDEITIGQDAAFVGKSLIDSGLRQDYGLIVVAVRRRSGKMDFNPSGSTLLESGDVLIALGEIEDLERLKSRLA
jgi:voltage-gated potassium channel